MIPAGLASAFTAWAYGDESRINQLIAERDALVAAMLNSGEEVSVITQAGVGSTATMFDANTALTAPEKLEMLNEVLLKLGKTPACLAPVVMTHARFDRLER